MKIGPSTFITLYRIPSSEEEIPTGFRFEGEAPSWRKTLLHNAPWLVLLAVVIARAALGILS